MRFASSFGGCAVIDEETGLLVYQDVRAGLGGGYVYRKSTAWPSCGTETPIAGKPTGRYGT
jgi:hypothetical protein